MAADYCIPVNLTIKEHKIFFQYENWKLILDWLKGGVSYEYKANPLCSDTVAWLKLPVKVCVFDIRAHKIENEPKGTEISWMWCLLSQMVTLDSKYT